MRRNQSLDTLRGTAVLLVILGHSAYGFKNASGPSGVDLFFVLSGYLIAGLLFTEYQNSGSITLKRFWVRRGFKIYPAFYAMLAFIIFVHFTAHDLSWRVFSDVFFMQDYFEPLADWGWSLGVEEKFYFLLPLVLLVGVKRKSFRFIPWVFIGLFAGCLFMRTFELLHFRDWTAIFRPAHLRIDGLFAGVTLAYFQHFQPELFKKTGKWWVLALGLAILFVDFRLPQALAYTIGFALSTVGYSMVLLAAVNWHMRVGWMAWVGRYSYSIYLWHLVVKVLTPAWLFAPACIFVGAGMAKLIEMPALKLRDTLFPKNVEAVVSSDASSAG